MGGSGGVEGEGVAAEAEATVKKVARSARERFFMEGHPVNVGGGTLEKNAWV
jgi:hypothetical protein